MAWCNNECIVCTYIWPWHAKLYPIPQIHFTLICLFNALRPICDCFLTWDFNHREITIWAHFYFIWFQSIGKYSQKVNQDVLVVSSHKYVQSYIATQTFISFLRHDNDKGVHATNQVIIPWIIDYNYIHRNQYAIYTPRTSNEANNLYFPDKKSHCQSLASRLISIFLSFYLVKDFNV